MTALLALLLTGPALAQDAPVEDLTAAYELELTHLHAELTSLQDERARLESDGEANLEGLRVEADGLRAALSRDQVAADRAEDRLAELERGSLTDTTRDETLAVTLEQAASTLRRQGVDLGATDDLTDAELLERTLAAGTALLQERASTRTERGSFFLPDGTEVDGTLVHLGDVATWGLSGEHGGPLAPGGGGALRLERDDPSAVQAWLDGDAPLVDLYLLDPTTRGDEARVDSGLWDQILAGGVLVWPILGLGLLALLVGLERLVSLTRHGSRTDRLLDRVLEPVTTGHIAEAKERIAGCRGAAARVVRQGLEHWNLDQERLEDVLSEAISRELPRLERFLPILAVIAAVAPLLGLLGTVTGMISTFEIITEHGTGDPKLLSGGISVALVTTQLGLSVAIPVLLLHALLSGLVDKVIGDMSRAALTFNNALHGVEFVRMTDGSWAPRGLELGELGERDEPTEGIGRAVMREEGR